MQRLRRLGRQAPSAATERLLLALALSVSLHIFLLYQFASHFKSPARPGLTIISARIADSTPALPHSTKPLEIPRPSASGRQAASSPPALPVAEPTTDIAVVEAPVSSALQDREPVSVSPENLETAAAEPGPSASDFPDPVHYPAKELDVYPRLLGPLAIDYPEAAGQQAGRVTLLLLVDESGRVTGVSVVDAQPEGVYEDAVTRAYSGAAFSPARKEGRVVRSRILVAVEIGSSTRADGE